MPSSHLTGKTKEDLATIAVVSGLLDEHQAKSMTKANLLKFLKQAETEAAAATQSAPPALPPPPKVARAVRRPADGKPAARRSSKITAAEGSTAEAEASATGAEAKTTGAETKTTGAEARAAVAEPAQLSDRSPVGQVIEPVSMPSADSTGMNGADLNVQPAEPPVAPVPVIRQRPQGKPYAAKPPAPAVSSQPATGPVQRLPAQPTARASARPVRPSQDKPSRPVHTQSSRSSQDQSSRPIQDKPGRPGHGRPTGSGTAARGGPVQTGRKQNRPNSRTPEPVNPGRPVRVKVFGIPVNPMADQLDEPVRRPADAELDLTATPIVGSAELGTVRTKAPIAATEFQSDEREVPSIPDSAPSSSAPIDRANQMLSTESTDESVDDEENESDNDSPESLGTGEKATRKHVESSEPITGVLEIMPDGYGFLRRDNYLQGAKDAYVPPQYIRRFNLRAGDLVTGPCKKQRDNDRYQALLYIKEVNGEPPEKMAKRPYFDRLTPIYPDERYVLETARNELSTRIIDLVAPIGKGQRGMIVSPPKAGKTILLQKIANAISTNNPGVKLIVLLIDERPEEVTDMQRSINGEVVYSTFDKTPENHVKVTELVLERAMRLVELNQDVVILLDSMTRLARAYNLTITPTGRTLSGGLDPGALYGPKRFFGAARNIENGGSLTIIATSLIETGSRMDEVIFEEFKGTGNMEVYLDRKLSEKRIFPAIDINRSGTRREELLLTGKDLDAVWTIRKAFGQLDTAAVTETIINLLLKTQNNGQFISSINVSFNDKNVFDAMRGTRPGAGNGMTNGSPRRPGSERDED